MGKTVSAFDTSASWVDVSRCEIESSYIDISFMVVFRLDCYVNWVIIIYYIVVFQHPISQAKNWILALLLHLLTAVIQHLAIPFLN